MLFFYSLVERGGFEPPKAEAGRFTVCSLWPLGNLSTTKGDISYTFFNQNASIFYGAGGGIRTRNLLITNQLLFR
jgi:hypothetical protein